MNKIKYLLDRKETFPYLLDTCMNSSSNSINDCSKIEFSVHVNEIKETRIYRVQRLVGRLGSNIEQYLGCASLNLPSNIPQIWHHPRGLCLTYENEKVRAKTILRSIKAEIENVE